MSSAGTSARTPLSYFKDKDRLGGAYGRLSTSDTFALGGGDSAGSTPVSSTSRTHSPTPSQCAPDDQHYAYSTSLRRQEAADGSSSIALGDLPQVAGQAFASVLAGGTTSSAAPNMNGSSLRYATTATNNTGYSHLPPAPSLPFPPPQHSAIPTHTTAHHPFAHTSSPMTPSTHYATQSITQTLASLSTSSTHGLASAKVTAIRELHGANEFQVDAKDPIWKKFLFQFKEPLILLLLGSAGVSAIVGNYDDAASIVAAIIIVVAVGFVQEQRSEKSLEALNKLVPHFCHLIRDGHKTTQLANVLVPGDLITFQTGDRIPADIRLTQAHGLEIDESTLTGETKPAKKSCEAILDGGLGVGGLPISERRNIGFMGTLVRSGRGEGIVVGTGEQSEFGVVFRMMQEIEDRKTPLQNSMDELAKKLSAMSFVVIGFICLIGVFQHRSWLDMFTIGVSLAVAAIPEGLPIVVTVTLALGVLRMSKRSAIVKKLPSVETLGSVSVICSDKTGTLTTNVMTVTQAYTVDDGIFSISHDEQSLVLHPQDHKVKLFLIGNLCNHSTLDRSGKNIGQPTEVALMNVLPQVGLKDVRTTFQRRAEVPFSSETKSQSVSGVFTSTPSDKETTYLSGAIESVLPRCRFYLRSDHTTPALESGLVKVIQGKSSEMASQGLRVVAFAYGPDPDSLIFAGLQAMMDPPRKGVAQAISQLQSGGIQVIMITGDSAETAISIARQLGLRSGGCMTGKELDILSQRQLTERIMGVTVFARTTPKHKMAIIEAYQSRGAVVAMTGDGVNDAPALKMADIGVSMGKGGTDVAKEAADVILVDDNFATLLPAVEEGKSIFLNIQNFLVFQLSTAVAALSLITITTLFGLPNPLNPMQILFINILMDGPPSQSLGVDPVNRDVMQRPPRSKTAPILDQRLLARVGFSASIIITGVMFVLAGELSDGSHTARDQTMTFTSFVFLDLASALQNRGLHTALLSPPQQVNRMLLMTVGTSFLVQLSLIYVPFLQAVFQTEALSFRDLSVLLMLGVGSMSLHEMRRRWERKNMVDELWRSAQTV
ncbi:calcium-transporting P-type ATPase, PMR1-type [Microbotryum lychnidis-dioicae p1A1 Lamole]|uniref:Calcium-transporting ATPase n=1 Tax=Microbotryum lychnidis-dioicae (strain p1A1 Lamole / MvSl-1064) TaxID=683840 RepID=U5H6C4_USTV1|nr:calcium-transporting P-type ATPase, PMR1-type [Microbotryum lychnidis-dioicae p1A1 Lamole]|eukprot:KDE06940.1 calcium-transporting P-type ATPase, PMR1-type [Microbotryum lychnidis-dioicae p1A1 Lamole]